MPYNMNGNFDTNGSYIRCKVKFKIPIARLMFIKEAFSVGCTLGNPVSMEDPVVNWNPYIPEYYVYVPNRKRFN